MSDCAVCGKPRAGRRTRFCSRVCFKIEKEAPIAVRFWRYVHKTDGCWTWMASKQPGGYGQIGNGATGRLARMWRAHRVSWELHNGPIPKGLFVCHKCDNPPCVRPDHLFLGTTTDNQRDAARKGRSNNGGTAGERHPRAKLTAARVADIRARWKAGGASQQAMATEYGVSKSTIHHVCSGYRWKTAEGHQT